ncbi:MAG TPA: ATP-binding protein [Steroidobacteraceae bacterium]|nr:ATP-binding protein [Steroidobacteraceae bacterium]
MLIDRERELQELRSLLDAGTPQLALLYGRRRVGKTFLLNHAWPREQTFYWTASETTPTQNREQLVRDFSEWSNESLDPREYPTWRSIFRLLLEMRAGDPLAIVLDEFQYLGEDRRGLSAVASELNAAWEQRRPPRPLVMALAGSAVSLMHALDEGGAPLHGRFSWKGELRPFDYWHAAKMANFRSLRDRARAYGIFGGTPRYLDVVKPAQPLADNATRLMLAPRGEVRGLVETAILQEQGLREIPKYQAIMRAIGSGYTELNQIGQRAGLPVDTPLRDKIERLIELQYVTPFRNLGAHTTTPFRYRLADPAFAFYYGFVSRHEALLQRADPDQVWLHAVAPRLETYMGHVFERIVEQAYARLQSRRDLPLVREWSRWEGKDRDGQSLEMDIAAPLTDGRVLTGAIKWNAKPLESKWHFHHLSSLERLASSGIGWAHQASGAEAPLLYVAAGGFTRDFIGAARASRETVYLWSLQDIFAPGESRRRRR